MTATILATLGHEPLGDADAIVDKLMGPVRNGIQLFQSRRASWEPWGVFSKSLESGETKRDEMPGVTSFSNRVSGPPRKKTSQQESNTGNDDNESLADDDVV